MKLQLSLYEFECHVLRAINVAPTQLHPNSWAFIPSFNILCRSFNTTLTASKFLSFFQVKLRKNVSWVLLSNLPCRGILLGFSSSYKGFKNKFFRIRSASTELFMNPGNTVKFPLYRTNQPLINGIESHKLSEEERHIINYLEKLPPLSSSELIRLGDDEKGLQEYMESMAPKMNSKILEEYLNKKMPKDRKTPDTKNPPAGESSATQIVPGLILCKRNRNKDDDEEGETQSRRRKFPPPKEPINISSGDPVSIKPPHNLTSAFQEFDESLLRGPILSL